MSLLSKFTRLVSQKAASALKVQSNSERLVAQALMPLKHDYPQFYQDACEFVLEGTQESVLHDASSIKLSNIKDTFGNFYNSEYWLGARTSDVPTYRYQLYIACHQGQVFIEQVIRLAQLHAQLLSEHIQKHTNIDFPDWLYLLLNDMLVASSKDDPEQLSLKVNYKPVVVDFNFYDAICEKADLPARYWLHYAFQRNKEVSGYSSGFLVSFVRRYFDHPNFKDYLLAHQDYLKTEVLPSLKSYGKDEFLHAVKVLKLGNEFAPEIIQYSIDNSKRVRESAGALFSAINQQAVFKQLKPLLVKGSSSQRKESANVLLKLSAQDALPLIKEALETEKSQTVIAHFNLLIGFVDEPNADAPQEAALELPNYAAIDLDTQVSDELVDIVYADLQRQQTESKQRKLDNKWAIESQKNLLSKTKKDAQKVMDALNGKTASSEKMYGYGSFINWDLIIKHPSVKLGNILSFVYSQKSNNRRYFWTHAFETWLAVQKDVDYDLRALEHAIVQIQTKFGLNTSVSDYYIFEQIINSYYSKSFLIEDLADDKIWPYFYQKIDHLISALDTPKDAYDANNIIARIVEVIACFPSIPQRLENRLMLTALGDLKANREAVQDVLMLVPDIDKKVTNALLSTKQATRINAAKWLAKINNQDAIAPLQEALKKEKREAAQAILLASLQSLGADISKLLTPSKLLKEAQAGLKRRSQRVLSGFLLMRCQRLSGALNAKLTQILLNGGWS